MKIEEKIKYFTAYLPCKIRSDKFIVIATGIDLENSFLLAMGGKTRISIERSKLILKPLKNITLKDAVECAKINGLPAALIANWSLEYDYKGVCFTFPGSSNPGSYNRNTIWFEEDRLSWRQVDYLRSQGYAIGIPNGIWEHEN